MRTCFAFAALVSGIACCSDSKSGADAGVDASTGPVDTGVPPGQAVVSDDGKVTAFVPEGALPAGTSLADLSVTAVAQADWPTLTSTSGEVRVLAAYSLEPDGLQFATPITLRLEVAGIPEGLAVTALHQSPNELETPELRLVFAQASSEVQFVDVEVAHFSKLVWVGENMFLQDVALQPVDPGLDTSNIPVGASFEMIGGVKVNRGAGVVNITNIFFFDATIAWGDNVPYYAKLEWMRASPNLSPAIDGPGKAAITSGNTAEVTSTRRTFTCDTAGPFEITFDGMVGAHMHVASLETASGHDRYRYFVGEDTWTGRCVAATGGPDAGTTGMPCNYAWECGSGRLCGDGHCKDDSGSKVCADDSECNTKSRPTCVDSGTGPRCGDCRTDADCGGGGVQCVNSHCVECDVDSDCASGFCGEDKACDECRAPSDCAEIPGATLCVKGMCGQCSSDADCSGTLGKCGEASICVQCTTDTDCAAPTPFCRNNICNSCGGSGDCPSLASPVCINAGCDACRRDYHCSGDYTCSAVGEVMACTLGCTVDADCVEGGICVSGQCADCNVDGDCPANAPFCEANFCIECRSTTDCSGGQVCETNRGDCVPCLTPTDCTDPALPVCSFLACGGCGTDADCTRFDPSFVCRVDGSCGPAGN